MANLTSTLTIALQDDVSGRAAKAAGALRQLGASGADLKRLAASSPEMARLTRELERLRAASGRIELFKGASANLDQLGIGLRKARQEVARFDAQIASRKKKLSIVEAVKAGDPSRYDREFKSKGITVEALALRLQGIERKRAAAAKGLGTVKAEFMEQGRAVRDLGRELTAAGVPLRGLKAAEDGLRASIEGVNREIARQPALFAASQARADAAAKASAATLRATVEAARAERAARQAAQTTVAAGKARADAARPAAAEAARAAVERGRAERRRLREDADLLNRMGVDAADVRKVPELAGAVAARKALTDKAGAIDGFRVDARGLKEAGLAYRQAQQDVRRLKAEMAAAPSDAVAQRLAAAQMAAVRAGEAFRAQGQAARASRLALTEAGISVDRLRSSEQALAGSIREATAALAGQTKALAANQRAQIRAAERADLRREALSTVGVGAGLAAGYQAKRVGRQSVLAVAEYDHAVRAQGVYTDVSDKDQAEVLIPQALRIGQETKFSNVDVVRAQTAAMQGLPAGFDGRLKAEVAQGIVENVKYYATLMDTDLKDGAETIRAYLQATGKDISTKDKALDEAQKAVNQIVKMSKLGGMSGEDAAQYVKYAASSATSAGLTSDRMLTLGALARRGGLRGDEAGVFMRSAANKLVAPTRDGISALNAAGIKHSEFVRMPDKLSTDALEGHFRNEMGKGFTPQIRKRLDQINSDKTLLGDRSKYTEAVTSAVGGILGKKKDGTVRASDAKVAARAAGKFHKLSAQEVDTNGLLEAIGQKKMTAAQLNAMFTDKHGGKFSLTQRQWDEFFASLKEIRKSGDDKNFAKDRSDKIMAGIYGSFENLKGSVENFYLAVGKANEGLLKFAFDGLGTAIDSFSKMPEGAQQATSLAAGAAAILLAARSAYTLGKGLLGFGGAAALTGSATALGGSAAALDAAAVALTRAAGAQAVGGAKGAAAGAAGSAAAGAAGNAAAGAGAGAAAGGIGVATGLILGGGAVGGAILGDAMPKAVGGGASLGEAVGDLAALRKRLADGETAGRSLGYARPARAVEMPGGVSAAGGFPTSVERSRGAVGDFLLGREKRTERLPLPPSMARAPAAGVVPRIVAPAVEADRAARDPRSLALPPAPDAAGIAEATAALAAFKSELAGVKADLATGLDMPGIGTGLEARKAELERLISDTQAKLQALGAETVSPSIDGAGLDAFGGQVDGAQAKLQALGAVSVTPSVGTGPIDALLSKLDAVLSKLSQVGSAAASANARIGQVNTAAAAAVGGQSTGRVGQRLGGSFTNATG